MPPGVRVFVDTGAWIALYVQDDGRHQAAVAAWKSLQAARARLFTSNHVLDEAVTRVRNLGGHALAVRFGKTLLASQAIERLYVDADVENDAWDWFVRFDDQLLSFTDCTSFALMRAHQVGLAFTFDTDFSKAGFQRHPAK